MPRVASTFGVFVNFTRVRQLSACVGQLSDLAEVGGERRGDAEAPERDERERETEKGVATPLYGSRMGVATPL